MLSRLKRPFYGWWIVAAAIVMQALPAGLLHQAYGSYVVLLERDFGWSRTTLSGAFAAIRLEEGLLGPLQGWLLDRFGPRAVMRVGTIIFALGFFLFARIDTVAEFYASFLIMAVGASLAGFLSITTAIVNWFERKRSMAMGIALLGTAVGGLSLPVVVWGLERWGWRAVADVSGIIILVVGLAVVQVIRHRPEQYGLLPDGRTPEVEEDGPATEGVMGRSMPSQGEMSFTTREAMRTRAFWFISLAHTASVLVVSVMSVHFVAYATESLGYTLSYAAAMVTVQTVTNLIGRPLGGWVADRTSSRLVIIVSMFGHMGALLLLTFAVNTWMVVAFALVNGLAWGARVPVIVSMRAEYFGSRSFGAIMGVSSMVVTAGAVIAPVAAAWAYDSTGSYSASFVLLAALSGLGSLFLIFLPPPAPVERASAAVPSA
ncbi:MAG: MFS transporter [Chloroflexi bacterium]|nr:MFS transporter [Chloroflexota bacterium]MDA1240782.1 MFS transporter [Chloroflexota bacterium]